MRTSRNKSESAQALLDRRSLLKAGLVGAGSAALAGVLPLTRARAAGESLFKISLAEWSLHGGIQKGTFDHLDFAVSAKKDYGIDAVEYVSQLFKDHDQEYLREMKTRADGEGVRGLLIMCDRLDPLPSGDNAARMKAVEGHYPWIEAAKFLGCHAIRVNARGGTGTPEEQMGYFSESMHTLAEFGAQRDVRILVENHGGISSNADWVAGVMKKVNHPYCGTLPDFGNSELGGGEVADPYYLVETLMPFAHGVSAKAEEFHGESFVAGVDAFHKNGKRVEVDYKRMMKIVLDAGYRGYVGVEYQGPDEPQGIRNLKDLLVRTREALSSEYVSG